MSSYTDIFGGAVVSPSYLNYSSFALTALNSPLTLVWPLQFENGTNVVSQIIDVTSDATRSMIMPDCTLVSVGQSVLFANVGGNTVNIYLHDGVTLLAALTTGTATYCYLIDNSTSNGTWRQTPWSQGAVSVVSVAAVSNSNNLVIGGSPITNAGTFTFTFANDLLALSSFGTGTGIPARTAANTWSLRTLTGTANQVTIANGAGIAGNPTFALASAVSGINSLTASNVRIGVTGTNVIDTADGNPLIVQDTLSIKPLAAAAQAIRWYEDDGTNYLAFKAPAAVAANVTWSLPPTDGTANQALITSGAGVLSFASVGAGTVTSIATGTGLTGGVITTAGTISIADTGVVAGTYTPPSVTFNAQGQAISATNIGSLSGTNRIINGDFQIWQRGAGGAASIANSGTTIKYGPDRWQFGFTSVGGANTCSQVAGAVSGSYLARLRRDDGEASVGILNLETSLTRSMCIGIASQPLTVSFKIKKGAGYSAAGSQITLQLYTGTGTTDVANIATQFTGAATVLSENIVLTANLTNYSFTSPAVGATVTQAAVVFTYEPSGVAADDYFDVTDVQLEIGAVATPFARLNFQEQLQNCLPFYEKSFLYATAPAQNVGANSGEFTFPATIAAANTNYSSRVLYVTHKRITNGTQTFYSPQAASAEVYDQTAGGACTATAVQNQSDKGFYISTTANAGTTVGGRLAVHYTIDADMPAT